MTLFVVIADADLFFSSRMIAQKWSRTMRWIVFAAPVPDRPGRARPAALVTVYAPTLEEARQRAEQLWPGLEFLFREADEQPSNNLSASNRAKLE